MQSEINQGEIMSKVYTDDQIEHAIKVGGNGYYLKGMLEQVHCENLTLRTLMAFDAGSHKELTESHLKLEDKIAELESLLDSVTS